MNEIFGMLERVREQKPLVHHITNWVTIYDCANVVRTVGALPVMAHAEEEVADMAVLASALVLNIGTLTADIIEAMKIAGEAANAKNIPVILDAVGAGATKLRDEKTAELLKELRIDIIKGNASEIAKIAGMDVYTKGVEAGKVEGDLKEIACQLARKREATVVITGRQDIVAGGNSLYLCSNGDAMMGSIVGTGCMATSVIGAFAAVEKDYAKAASAALSVFGIAGEIAAQHSAGPGTFKINFYDTLYNISEQDVEKLLRMEKLR